MTDMVTFIEKFVIDPDSTCRRDNGCRGEGGFASVFDSDMPNLVIKHGYGEFADGFKDGWLMWAIYAMNEQRCGNDDSILPNIQALVIDYTKREFWAVMELLEETHDKYWNPGIAGLVSEVVYNGHLKLAASAYPILEKHHEQLKKHLAQVNDLFTVKGSYLFFDAHEDNWMWRNGELVLTDPFTVGKTYGDGIVPEYNEILKRMAEGNPKIKIIT